MHSRAWYAEDSHSMQDILAMNKTCQCLDKLPKWNLRWETTLCYKLVCVISRRNKDLPIYHRSVSSDQSGVLKYFYVAGFIWGFGIVIGDAGFTVHFVECFYTLCMCPTHCTYFVSSTTSTSPGVMGVWLWTVVGSSGLSSPLVELTTWKQHNTSLMGLHRMGIKHYKIHVCFKDVCLHLKTFCK